MGADKNNSLVSHDDTRTKWAHIASMDEYRRMYRESIENPHAFWSAISDRFYWETKWHTVNKINFNTAKGPISIEW